MFGTWGLNLQRHRLLAKLPDNPLRDYYRQAFPSAGSDCRSIEFVALDLETTGLDPEQDVILSIGLVTIRGLTIELGSAEHHLLCPHCPIPEQSAVIHCITDDQAAKGKDLAEVLPGLLAQLSGKVMIAHYAAVEMQFLDRACRKLYGGGFVIPVVDTQRIAKRSLERRNQVIRGRDLRLAECRRRLGLPHYRMHNALSDALASGELFLVQLAQYDCNKKVALKHFL
ncbi:MAG: exonuclease domain-containing protein [Thiohalomonadaceae bacterium]